MLQMGGESSIFISGLTYPHIQFLMSTEKTCRVWKDIWNKLSWRRLWSDEKDITLFCNFLVTCSCFMVRLSIWCYESALHLRWKPHSITMACKAPQYLAAPSPFNSISPYPLLTHCSPSHHPACRKPAALRRKQKQSALSMSIFIIMCQQL